MSYDIIGDIIILDERAKLNPRLLLKKYKNVKVIFKKAGIHSGKYRTQKLKWLAGEKRKETIHKESGCLFKLDVEKCYFSPRLSNERLRIDKLIKKHESILVPFSGIAVYPVIISKMKPVKEIYAVEINPIAHKYAEENIKLNKVSNVKLFKGDIKKVLPKIKKKFDRIIMPLPKNAPLYLNLIKKHVKKNTIIHLYTFFKQDNFKNQANNLLKKYLKKFKILKITKCGAYSPYIYRVCIDIKL